MTFTRLQASRHLGRLAGLLVVLAGLAPGSALAVQGIGISPTSQELALAPGSTTTGSVTVLNDGDSDVIYHVYATDYNVSDENYKADFSLTGRAAAISPVSWFKLPAKATHFTIHSHDQVQLPYTIVVPSDAAVGGHYATIFVETIPPPSAGAAIINRVERIGSIFYLAINGDLKHSGQVHPVEASRLVTSVPFDAFLRFSNTGNVHDVADGKVQLVSVFGHVSNSTNFHGEVLPQTTRRFSFNLKPPTAIGLYQIKATTHYLGHDQTLTKWVFVVPMLTLIIVGATVAILLLWLVIWLARRRRK